MIEIWEPRWKDKKVLIAVYKVTPGENKIKFTKTKSLPGTYKAMGEDIKTFPIESNGKIDCFAFPLDKLEKLN